MKIRQQVKYILFEIEKPIGFKLIYLLEKFLKLPILFLNRKFNFSIKIPYLFYNDFVIENKNGKWLNKARTDYDYAINPYVEKDLEKFFNSQGIFLDIGAHVGKWSIFVGNKNRKVYSFEPNPITYEYLKKNIYLNKLGHKITTFNLGAGEKKGSLNFLLDVNETSKSRFSDRGNIEVGVIAIDDFILENQIDVGDIDLVKIDTEGFEYNVLKGMKNFLNQTKKVTIICEVLDSQKDKKSIFRFFESFGFEYKRINTSADYIFYKKL